MEEKVTVSREEQIIAAFDDLRTARTELHEVSEKDLVTHATLKAAETAILLQYADDPKKLGGNEPARNAKIRELTATERSEAEKSEAEKRKCSLTYELASMRVQELQLLVRSDQAAADCEAMGLH